MNIEREIALQALMEFRKSGAWPDLYLKNKLNDVSRAQAALATNITYGVLQKQSLLDYYISCFSSVAAAFWAFFLRPLLRHSFSRASACSHRPN